MKVDYDESARIQRLVDTLIHNRSGLSFEAIKAMEAYDHYMTPEQAKSLNLIDTIHKRHKR